jgi:hypothetical protein
LLARRRALGKGEGVPHRTVASLFLSGLALAAAMGCEDAMRAPPPGMLDGATGLPPVGKPPGTRPRTDGGLADGGEIIPMSDGGALPGCVTADVANHAFLQQEGVLLDFEPATAYVTWASGDACDIPRLVVALSDDTCRRGVETALELWIDEASIGTSLVTGPNLIEPAPFDDSLRVRLYRGAEVYGTCTGSSGSVTIDALGSRVGSAVRLNFSMTLTDCTSTRLPINVEGLIDLRVGVAYADICG